MPHTRGRRTLVPAPRGGRACVTPEAPSPRCTPRDSAVPHHTPPVTAWRYSPGAPTLRPGRRRWRAARPWPSGHHGQRLTLRDGVWQERGRPPACGTPLGTPQLLFGKLGRISKPVTTPSDSFPRNETQPGDASGVRCGRRQDSGSDCQLWGKAQQVNPNLPPHTKGGSGNPPNHGKAPYLSTAQRVAPTVLATEVGV